MGANPFLGVVLHWIGGFAAASFYIPYRGVKRWSWETYWLVGGVFSWIVAPWVLATLLVPNVWAVLRAAAPSTIFWAYLFGALWGFGGLTFGLTMRYLGIALGMAVALGYTAAFGTLMPPIFAGEFGQILASGSGRVILAGVAVCLTGIVVSGLAGMSKERELSAEEKQATIKEFSFTKGMLVATFSGIMSACFAYGLAAGKPIAMLTRQQLALHGRMDLWQNLPVLIVVLLGGFTTNFAWCVILNVRNRSAHEYLNLTSEVRGPKSEVRSRRVTSDIGHRTSDDQNGRSGGNARGVATVDARRNVSAPLLNNYVFSAVAGVTWYLQFFFYSMGQTKMGAYEFSSWTIHMASIIIFSTLWGVALHEWKGASRKTHALIAVGLAVLIGSTVIVGYGNFLKTR